MSRADPPEVHPLAGDYSRRRPIFDRLREEVLFAVNKELRQRHIKTHSVTGRVKELPSIIGKAERKGLSDPLAQLTDVVGVRVVCLFLTDLLRVRDLLRDCFEVVHEDDKISGGDESAFGYMSAHYIVKLRAEHVGPRYDDLKDLAVEIQVRTILMDAWANVSHYLDYKGEASIPRDLRRDFFALSGLFYVADKHFELFFGRAEVEQERAAEEVRHARPGTEIELNLATLGAFLKERYPDRRRTNRALESGLVEQLAKSGIVTVQQLDAALRGTDKALARFEREHPPRHYPGVHEEDGEEDDDDEAETAEPRFADVAAVRLSLGIADKAYRDSVYPGDTRLEKYERFIDRGSS